MKSIIEKVEELAKKYKMKAVVVDNGVNLVCKDIDDKDRSWIEFDINSDTVQLIGNTDNCNLWFYKTRKDLTPEILLGFVNDLNKAFEINFTLRELIDPEDWQEIANVSDASTDNRYK